MPIKESSATALVRFTGFGFIAFNRSLGIGEIGAIRDANHTLTARVRRPVFQDGAGKDLVVYQDVATYQNLPQEGVQFEIKALSGPAVEGFEIYQGGNFDRLSSNDVNDFRWVVNMDALDGEAPLAPTGQRPHPMTKILVRHGVFYTHSLDPRLSFEKVELDASGAAVRREVFGNVAETVGVKIEAAEVGFTVRRDGAEETHTLPRVEGLPYLIEFKNMDYNPDAVYSDMADYYGYLSSPSGRQFRLEPIREDEDEGVTTGGSVNQRQFCHPVVTDLESVDEL